jgi:hypothetical protein
MSQLEIPATVINPINIFIYGGTPKEFWFKSCCNCCNLTSGTHPWDLSYRRSDPLPSRILGPNTSLQPLPSASQASYLLPTQRSLGIHCGSVEHVLQSGTCFFW